ncbi:Crp/Fnr family transcriptional regulator [Tenacibaculum amylolyticum]|uniref:Crp/Fnr family transcriptional regulator n=1 Tax=Tenacibaculum amylolyticum TaxID=104269 RepID=UPI003895E9E1
MQDLLSDIKKHISLTATEEEMILAQASIHTYAKKQILEDYQTIYNTIYFVTKGCIQLCVMSANGTEHTLQFSIKGWWLTDFDSFNYQKASSYQLKAVSNTEVIQFTRTQLQQLQSEIPQLAHYFKVLAERAYAASLYRISLMMTLSKEERYFNYTKDFARFADKVPQYILASYLGLTPEYLSEIRNKKTKS